MKPNGHDAAERAVLGCCLEQPNLLSAINLSVNDFSTSWHREIWEAMQKLGPTTDPTTVTTELSGRVDAGYISGLICAGVLVENFQAYTKNVHKAAVDRKFGLLRQQLNSAENGTRLGIVEQMRTLLTSDAEGWRGIFHRYNEILNAPPLRFAINGFLPLDGITLLGGLAGHSKTLAALSLTRSLLSGMPLFGHDAFSVPERANRVCYLVPEASLSSFASRLKLFRLEEFLSDDRLLVRTLSHREQHVSLDDPRVLQAAKGA